MKFFSRFPAFFFGGSVFFLFLFFSWLVHKGIFTQFDFDTTVRLQDNIPRRFDDILSLLSDVGSFELLTVALVILLVVWRKLRGVLFLFSYVTLHVVELYGKFFVSHTPPPEFMLRTKQLLNFPQFYVRAENSYPSGHAGRTLFLTTVLIVLVVTSKKLSPGFKLILVGLLALFDLAMLVSRIYLGEHWTSDVLGGALLGVGLAVGTYAIAK